MATTDSAYTRGVKNSVASGSMGIENLRNP